jgi:hypothetical protein
MRIFAACALSYGPPEVQAKDSVLHSCYQSCGPCSPIEGRFQNTPAPQQRTIRHLDFCPFPYEPEGREFESLRAHHTLSTVSFSHLSQKTRKMGHPRQMFPTCLPCCRRLRLSADELLPAPLPDTGPGSSAAHQTWCLVQVLRQFLISSLRAGLYS